jgi:hypothetical protein
MAERSNGPQKRMRFITLVVSDKGSRPSFENVVSSMSPGTNEHVFSFIQIARIAWGMLVSLIKRQSLSTTVSWHLANDTSQN